MADLMQKFESINPMGDGSMAQTWSPGPPAPLSVSNGDADTREGEKGADDDDDGRVGHSRAGGGGEGVAGVTDSGSRGKSIGAGGGGVGGEDGGGGDGTSAYGGKKGFNLEAVPAFYFERDFRLEDSKTFESTGAATDSAAAACTLQESLSEHLDAVGTMAENLA